MISHTLNIEKKVKTDYIYRSRKHPKIICVNKTENNYFAGCG